MKDAKLEEFLVIPQIPLAMPALKEGGDGEWGKPFSQGLQTRRCARSVVFLSNRLL